MTDIKKWLTVLRTTLFVAGALLLSKAPLGALASGDAARLELGQVSMTLADPNTVSGAGLYKPQAVAVGPLKVYLADTFNNRVLWWDSSLAFSNGRPADGVLGQADLSGSLANRGLPAADNSLSAPTGVAVDGFGNVWVADTGNNRVLMFPNPGPSGEAASIVLGQPDFISGQANRGVIGSPNNNTLYSPQGLWLDASGNLWVADNLNNRVLMFPNSAPFTTDEVATVVIGEPDMTTVAGGTTADTLLLPGGVSGDAAGNVWVADTGNNRVLRYATPVTSAQASTFVLGQGNLTSGNANRGGAVSGGTLYLPQNLTVNGTALWVTDSANNRLLQWNDPFVKGLGTDADLYYGQPNLTSSTSNAGGFAASGTRLSNPVGLAVDGSNNVWVTDSDNNRLIRYTNPNTSNIAATLALGQKDLAQYAVNTPSAQSLYTPAQLALDKATGRLYAADSWNNRVLWWNSAASFANRQPADGVLGQADFTSVLPNRGGAVIANNGLDFPTGVAVDASGNLWVLDAGNSRVLRFIAPSVNGQAANRIIGQAAFNTAATGSTGQLFLGPVAIAFDNSNRLWVSDQGNNRALRFSNFSIDNPAADYVLGQANYTGSGSGSTAQTLNTPTGIYVDVSSNVWIADTFNNRVLRYPGALFEAAFPGAAQAATLVFGQTNFTNNNFNLTGGAAVAGGLNAPASVWLDAAGNAWVADTGNSRVIRFDNAPFAANSQAAALTLGQANLTSSGGNRNLMSPDATTLNSPAFALNSGNNLWLSDAGNNRVLQTGPLYGTNLGLLFTGASSTTLTAAWSPVPTSTYVVVLASDAGFATIVSSTTQSTLTTKTFDTLASGVTYYLELKLSTETDSAYAANLAARQTLLSVTPLSPALAVPSIGNLAATWTAVPGASFNAVLATDSGYTAIVSSSVVGPSVYTKAFTGLSNYTTYYFEVKLTTEADTSYAFNTVSTRTLGGTLSLTSVTPDKYMEGTEPINMTLLGAGFINGATVKLTRTGKTDVVATTVAVVSPTRITASIPEPLEAGVWNVSLTNADQTAVLANAFALLGAAPNSAKIYQGVFKPLQGEAAQLASNMVSNGHASIKVFDQLGRVVRVIYDGARSAGTYLDPWDGRNDKGTMVASGIYLVRFKCTGFDEVKRVVVIK